MHRVSLMLLLLLATSVASATRVRLQACTENLNPCPAKSLFEIVLDVPVRSPAGTGQTASNHATPVSSWSGEESQQTTSNTEEQRSPNSQEQGTRELFRDFVGEVFRRSANLGRILE